MNPVDDAIAIWKAGVAAVDPRKCVVDFLRQTLESQFAKSILDVKTADRILVVGGGKAGAAMAAGVVDALAQFVDKIEGVVNVPEGAASCAGRIRLNAARVQGSNFPTQEGVDGSRAMLRLFKSAGPNDLGIALISGGGSALLPAPVEGLSLADKLELTKRLHVSGAGINEMNCVRKHLSAIKGGRLAQAFRGRWLETLVISDVVGDPLDVIASGPTVPDPTTFADAVRVLVRYGLWDRCSPFVKDHLTAAVHETLKLPIPNASCSVIASNNQAIVAAGQHPALKRIRVDACSEAYSNRLSEAVAKIARRVRFKHQRPNAFIFGGETTVALGPNPGKGGRNQEFVLAMLCELGEAGMDGVTILCAGTDGEDGPTDAAGAIGTADTLRRAKAIGLDPHDYLKRHDAYHFFDAVGGLFKTGLTGTNVMDLGVILLR